MKTRETYLLNAILSVNMKVLTDCDTCTGPRFSFVPYGTGTCTLIGHIIIPESLCADVISCRIVDDSLLNVSRHHPLILNMNVLHSRHEPVHDSYTRTRYNWKPHSNQFKYKHCVSELLGSCEFDYNDVNHTYDVIVDSITAASESKLLKREFKPYLKPYWSNELKRLHEQIRRERNRWKNDSKPRVNADSYNCYKNTKRKFRRLLRQKFRQFEREEN